MNDEGIVTRDVYVTLAAIAGRTDRVLLGPGITNPYVRHPGATAAAIASLDELSGGRAFLGLGAGGGLTLGPLAIDRRRPIQAVAEMIDTLRALFGGETVTHDGEQFGFAEARLDYGRPDLQIIVAGRGPRMFELGGTHGDGFSLSYLHKELLAAAVADLRAAASARRVPFFVTWTTIVATTDAELEAARAQLSFRLVDSPRAVKERIGMSEQDTAAIRAALASGGPGTAAALVRPEWVPHFAIVGSEDECGAELTELLERADIDEFQVPVYRAGDGATVMRRVAAMF